MFSISCYTLDCHSPFLLQMSLCSQYPDFVLCTCSPDSYSPLPYLSTHSFSLSLIRPSAHTEPVQFSQSCLVFLRVQTTPVCFPFIFFDLICFACTGCIFIFNISWTGIFNYLLAGSLHLYFLTSLPCLNFLGFMEMSS